MRQPPRIDFNLAPFLLIWETTQACALACKHCRAEAINSRNPEELSFKEGQKLISDTAQMGTPIFIFSGGDCLQREDLEDLIRFAKSKSLHTGAIPAATERLTRERVVRLKDAGLDQMALSLDGGSAATHDAFRGIPGSFDKTMEGARFAREAGIPLQINTCFGIWNYAEFEAISRLVTQLGIVFWEVFFMVPTGRGSALDSLNADTFENLFGKIYRLAGQVRFVVKVTEAPHYRRHVLQQEPGVAFGPADPSGHLVKKNPAESLRAIQMAPTAVNAGKGFCFVSHTGEVYPSGFLPVSAGNVRKFSVIDIYRDSPLFNDLRNFRLLKGRCGKCEYRELCGGSRSRAYAVTGDYLSEEPSCSYEPQPLANCL